MKKFILLGHGIESLIQKRHFHKRSNIESTNGAIKRKFGETLKSKNRVAQENELLAKIIAYNLTVVIHEMYENGINPSFLNERLEKTISE